MTVLDFFTISFNGVTDLAYSWVWLVAPIGLGIFAWEAWIHYINAKFLDEMKFILLEIKLPKEIRRSPLAMELVLNSMHQTLGVSTWYARYWKGKLRLPFSLEIVSIEGKVHFFIRTPKGFENTISSYIYAQYPEAEVSEASDYTKNILYAKNGSYNMFAVEPKLTKPDPYPIKTYIDYGMDKSAKEEERIDPLTPMIELLGSMKKGEQIWLQIIIRAATNRYRLPGKWFKRGNYKDEASEEITKIKESATDTTGKFNTNLLTPGQKNAIEALERNTDKLGFDVGIRTIYIAEKNAYKGENTPAILGILRQYNSANLNGFALARLTAFDYPWQDFKNIRLNKMKKDMFDFYRLRSFFYPPANRTPFVLSSEELATIYHFPGGVSGTPSFERIESKKSEPPVNLPV